MGNYIIGKTKYIHKELVKNPKKFRGHSKYETFLVCEEWGIDKDAYLFNAIKKISSVNFKENKETIIDLEKAIWYLQARIIKFSSSRNTIPLNNKDFLPHVVAVKWKLSLNLELTLESIFNAWKYANHPSGKTSGRFIMDAIDFIENEIDCLYENEKLMIEKGKGKTYAPKNNYFKNQANVV